MVFSKPETVKQRMRSERPLDRKDGYRNRLTYRLLVLSNTLGKGAVRLYAGKYGIPLAQWRLLAVIALEGTASIGDLSEKLATDKGWISRAAASLTDRGLVKGVPDARDSRRLVLGLTDNGRKLHSKIVPAWRERQRRLAAVLTKHEEAVLDRVLGKLQREAEQILIEVGSVGRSQHLARRKPRSD